MRGVARLPPSLLLACAGGLSSAWLLWELRCGRQRRQQSGFIMPVRAGDADDEAEEVPEVGHRRGGVGDGRLRVPSLDTIGRSCSCPQARPARMLPLAPAISAPQAPMNIYRTTLATPLPAFRPALPACPAFL